MEIKNSADLKEAIRALEDRKLREKQQLVENFQEFTESIKPINLLKSTFQKVKETPGITGGIVKATVGVGVGILSKRLIFGKSPGIFRKIVGSAIEMGLVGLLAKNSERLQVGGARLLKAVLKPNR